jgi:hypothetical protein
MAIKINNTTVIDDSRNIVNALNGTFDGTGALKVPSGNTSQRPTPATGQIRYNTQEATFEGYNGSIWGAIGGGGGGFSVTNDITTNSTYYPVFVDSTTGTPTQTSVSNTKLTFNPSTGNFSATAFTSLSDATKKTNIRPIENSIELTKQLEGVRYDWIDNNKPSLGLIAQEVEKVLPELVETSTDGTKSISYGNIVGVLIEAIKEQQVRIEELERKLNA